MRKWRQPTVYLLLCFIMAWATMYCSGKKDEQKADTTQDTEKDSTKAGEDTTGQAEKKEKAAEEEAVPVKVAEIHLGDISSYLLFSSTVEVERDVDVYAQETGLVEQVSVEEGDHVQKDQILAELNDDEVRLTEAKANVNLKKLQSDFKRIKDMYEKDLISREQYENATYQLQDAEIEWDRAKLALDHTKIRASIEGVIAERAVKLGDRVYPNIKLFSIVDTDSLMAKVYIPGKDARALRTGQRALITSDFVPGTSFAGGIKRISPVVDPNSGTFKVTVGIRNEANPQRDANVGTTHASPLKPGMFVNVKIITETHHRVPMVSKNAIVYDGGLRYVFVIHDSVAVKTSIEPGFSERDSLEVLSGIAAGDSIIVVGQEGLKDRAKVKVVTEDLLPKEDKEVEDRNRRKEK